MTGNGYRHVLKENVEKTVTYLQVRQAPRDFLKLARVLFFVGSIDFSSSILYFGDEEKEHQKCAPSLTFEESNVDEIQGRSLKIVYARVNWVNVISEDVPHLRGNSRANQTAQH